MLQFIQYVEGQWAVIAQAPFAFLIGAVLVAGLVYALVRHQFAERLENLEGRLALRDDEISDYKRKLEGASPEEARVRIDVLEGQIKALSPRRLTPQSKAAMMAALGGRAPGNIHIAHDMAAGRAKALVTDLAALFREAGWQVQLPSVMGIGSPPRTGIALQVRDVAALRPAEQAVSMALRAAAIDVDLQPGLRQDPHADTRNPNPDVGLLITDPAD